MTSQFNTLKALPGKPNHYYYSLPALEKQGIGKISRLPISIRVVLESVLRNCDEKKITAENVKQLANWNAEKPGNAEIPFVVARVLLQDFTGVPLLVDLAAMREAIAAKGMDPGLIEPLVPVDLIIDHSVQVDRFGTEDSYLFNLKTEFERNQERYEFLKWGSQAFQTLKIVPPGIGICHQVNLELISTVVSKKEANNGYLLYPDTLVGTDSHTTMVNGLGVVGWGVGGIEAEAAMLGQPVFIPMPEVIGLHMSGQLREGVTATDLTLRVTELLRAENVVGKFVEYFGDGAASLSVADRATMANMSPEYGATIGFYPVDEKSLDYMRMTGRSEEHIAIVREYLEAQGMFGIPRQGEVDYTKVLELDLSSVNPCVSGPKRPQDRIELSQVKMKFEELMKLPLERGGYGKGGQLERPKVCVHSGGTILLSREYVSGGKETLESDDGHIPEMDEAEMVANRPITYAVSKGPQEPVQIDGTVCDTVLTHGSVVIAAITSCTNTSNPNVMIGAGLLAKKAVEKGLKVNKRVKTSLAPGSRVVTDYLEKSGLQRYLNALGFNLVAYGCTTCIGNSGPLDDEMEEAIRSADLVTASVLSGNRNFEARIHGSVKANFLMSPPLVVAFAIAGRIDINFDQEPLGYDREGNEVYLKDVWPTQEEVNEAIQRSLKPTMFSERYSNVESDNPVWKGIEVGKGLQYPWKDSSTYIQCPPYFAGFEKTLPEMPPLEGMRPLAIYGDSVTTDHISPAGAFKSDTSAGKYLISKGVEEKRFNSYGSRRGNHNVMMRGTFANVRIRNQMADGKEGGWTKLMPEGKLMPLFDASQEYQKRKIPLIVFAGKDYGMGSSRDWAAKGTALLGVHAVVAGSFERIHRSNLVGMGVLPLQFMAGDNADSLGLTGEEIISVKGLEEGIRAGQEVELHIEKDGKVHKVPVIVRLETPVEVDYYKHGGIMPYVLRQLIA
ncbi:aconitate hydratase [Waddlia chondrophila]|uniref:Aconitate hydratase A n=1 Tax=Waddlia chondrophila (strain ATCC VR-1470 / WSU 86-1044) TaxID=716544 RepID=D6YVU3_WADCW|nr:aconitate hydratase [Waddlia chondrophila]ADI38254.1 aconitate hydratase [Waddlia chondrophila WSU 86-1044]